MNISGDPAFSGNYVAKTGYEGKANGADVQAYPGATPETDPKTYLVRQDIAFPAFNGNAPFIQVSGALTSDPGSIWVWAESHGTESYQHYKDGQQFATLAESLRDADAIGLTAFRDAQDDDASGNTADTYLTGVTKSDGTLLVYWGLEDDGAHKVILRKVDTSYESLAGRTFDIYKGSSTVAYTPKGAEEPLTSLRSGASGCFFVGVLPNGTYIVEETSTDPHRFFYVIVDDTGTYGTLETDASGHETVKAGGYATRAEAEAAAKVKSDALKAARS